MKLHHFQDLAEGNDPAPKQEIVDKFADTDAKTRTYYIYHWAKEKGIDSDDAMHMAGYVRDGYMGAGAWNWRYVGMGESVQEVAGAQKCWPGHKKVGTQPGTGKNKGKRVNKCVKEDESGMIGEPDSYYDAEDRTEAYNDLQDILQGNFMDDYIKDGVCPECAGSGYMDGEDEVYNDETEEYEEGSECDGFGNYGCDEGEMTQNDDGLPNWAEIAKHDERQVEKANRGPAPSKEQIMKLLPRLHDEYVKSGRYNAFELPSILRQMYPELSKREAGSYVGEFLSNFKESTEQTMPKSKREKEQAKNSATGEFTPDDVHYAMMKRVKAYDKTKKDKVSEDSGEATVAKMLAKALGDENRWTEMSAIELYAELESTNPEVADMISKVARMLYDVKLQERAYKDVGVADTVKDQRGKEFQFDKGSKKFKSQDGEEADVSTKLGKDLMRLRKNHMKRTSPSYPNKHSK